MESVAARVLIDLTGVPLTVEEVLSQSSKGLEKAFTTVKPLPGVLKLVKHLEKHNVPMAVSHSSLIDLEPRSLTFLLRLDRDGVNEKELPDQISTSVAPL